MATAEPVTQLSTRPPPTDPSGPTGRLATWLAGTKIENVPSTVREHAKYLLLDGIACALVGAQLPVSRKGVEAVTALDNWYEFAYRVGRPCDQCSVGRNAQFKLYPRL